MESKGTVVVTGGSQGIGFAVVAALLERGYAVVATARKASESALVASARLALVDGDIKSVSTAQAVAETAVSRFGSIDHVVANAGISIGKPFLDYTVEDYHELLATNLEGFFHIAQVAVEQMLSQGRGGSITSITSASVDHPDAASPSAVQMFTKGGLSAGVLALASEYAKQHIRFNAVAPGTVDTPMHINRSRDFLRSRSPMGTITSSQDIAEAVIYLTEAKSVTGEILRVDGGSHVGRW